ncbi:MAG: HPr(Ser) kinase/phosphatase [Streptococcaceae bacterium]|jgi:HPr kinase/phosphorylase|nr:HPr(Ser) kinase/phosphatase [Streptococcaceae bacterium]
MTVTVQDLIKRIKFDVIAASDKALAKEITTSDVTRPGLEMAGFFDYFSPERVQIFGKKEHAYMMGITPGERAQLLKRIFSEETPAVIVARGLFIPEEMVTAAHQSNIALLCSHEPTSHLSGKISLFLDEKLAPRTSIHGVLMDLYGLGVLIQGESGIGKSELGLELIRRGHRLIADDRVEVYKQDELTVVGEAPEILKNLIEIRGVGIIDVMSLFGAGALKESVAIDLVVKLENFDDKAEYDRLGTNSYTISMVDVSLPLLKIPVKIGRNIAVIIETAVMNFRARETGYDATKMFEDRLTTLIEKNSAND